MDQRQQNRLTLEQCGKKFRGHDKLISKYDPQIPASAEREYVRITNAYIGILKEELEKEFLKLQNAYKKNRDAEVRENRRNDGFTDFMMAIAQVFNTIKNNIISKAEGFGLRRKLESLSHMNRKLTVKEWKKAIKSTLGIDIREDYYLGDFYLDQLQTWVDENVSLIKSIPEDTLDKMRDIVLDDFNNGKTTTKMAKDIQRAYGVSRRKAELLARDQTAKLNGQIQRHQQMDVGINEYIWSTCGNENVRKSHNELNNKVFSWDDAPENSDGRKCHPGQDYNCRCIGRPIFDRRTLNLPIAGSDNNGAIRNSSSSSSKASTAQKMPNNRPDTYNDTDTKAVHDYMTSKSYVINEKLRTNSPLTEDEENLRIDLDNALKKAPRYKGNLQRSLYFYDDKKMEQFLSDYQIGKSVNHKEYISTTKGNAYNPEGQVQIYIQDAKKGRDISFHNVMENEVLYERDTAFEVVNIDYHEGKHYILLKEE